MNEYIYSGVIMTISIILALCVLMIFIEMEDKSIE